MPFIHDVGKVSINNEVILWTIPDFFTFPQTVDSGLWSPEFKFLGKRWQIGLWPNGWKQDSSEGWIGIGLMNKTDKAALRVRLGLKRSSREPIQSQDAEWDGETWFDSSTFILRSEFESRKDEIVKDGILTVICEIFVRKDSLKSPKERTSGETSAIAVKESQDKNKVKKTQNKPLNFSEFVGNIRKLFDVCEDFDVILRVKGFEHRVHRSILIDRCERFACILSHAKDGEVIFIEVDDCEPDAFREFLVYLYTGVVDAINKYNALDTYYVAHKYEISDLKEKCLEFMEENLDYWQTFSLLHMAANLNDPELLKLATDMFVENVEEILDTCEWYNFLCDHPAQANDLFIKVVKKLKETKRKLKNK